MILPSLLHQSRFVGTSDGSNTLLHLSQQHTCSPGFRSGRFVHIDDL
jgi:hypothetical protein